MSALRSHLSGKRYRACFDAMPARKMKLILFRSYERNSAKLSLHFLNVRVRLGSFFYFSFAQKKPSSLK